MSNKDANELKYGRIVYYEPNEIFGDDNQPVPQEELTKYVNLSVRVPSRYWDKSNDNIKKYESILKGCLFDDGEYKKFYLTDNYVNVSYNEFGADGSISAGELFGIDSIDISFDVQFFPQVTINFTDVKGFGLMSTMEYNYENAKIENLTAKSFFTSLFNFPYPIFTLEVKGYYGKSVSFDLSLLDFHTSFESQTGNFITTVTFVGHMYGVYADIPMSYLMISPYIDYENLNKYSKIEEPVGDEWKKIGEQDIPTYIHLLKKFNFLLNNTNINENYNISNINAYLRNNEKINNLTEIYDKIENIIESCKQSVIFYGDKISLNPNGIFYVRETEYLIKNSEFLSFTNSFIQPELGEKLERYKELLNICNKNNEYEKYIPKTIFSVYEEKYYLWTFENIIELKNECLNDIENLENNNNNINQSVNTELLNYITENIGIRPSIKNIYKILFKHLNCFSNHFFNTLNNIDLNRTIRECGLSRYETDIPSNPPQAIENNIVPPFPAVYKTDNEGKKIIYPGEIPEFINQPEVKLTENIFNSINYFGKGVINTMTELEGIKEVANKTTLTTRGTFFIDGVRGIDENSKHYNIVRPFNSQNYGVIEKSETICDIFLSRLATFGRLHYMDGSDKHNGDYFAESEAKLLTQSFPTMGEETDLITSLMSMYRLSESEIREKYNKVSGGVLNGELWGFINYKPNTKVTEENVEQLAKEGIIHYNGYSGSTIIVYNSGVTLTDAEKTFREIDFDDAYKVKGDATYDPREGEEWNIYSIPGYKTSFTLYANKITDTTPSSKFNIAAYRKNSGDYNWGAWYSKVIGGEETRRFIMEKYTYLDEGSGGNSCRIPRSDAETIAPNGFIPQYITSNVAQKNRISLLHPCAILAVKDAAELKYINDKNQSFNMAIPISPIKEEYQEDFNCKFITDVEINENIDSFYDDVYSDLSELSAQDLNNKYLVFAKCVQYDRSDDSNNLLSDEKIYRIWRSFLEKVFNRLGLEIIPTSVTFNKNEDRDNINKEIKTNIYYTLKTLYDKWYSGLRQDYFKLNEKTCEFNKIHYLTTSFNNISDTMIVDLESLINQVNNTVLAADTSPSSVLSFMAQTAQDNNSTFLVVPMKFSVGETKNDVNEIFKPYNFYNGTAKHDVHGVSYVIMHNGDVSHHLANNKSEYANDGYDIANYIGNEITETEDAKNLFIINEHDYTVSAFGVTYGMQNQNYFKNISVDTTNPSITDYSIANTLVISEQGSGASVHNNIPSAKTLYPIYANRSYTCSVEMMGCMNITPLMYFQLNNVPMFRGAYMITNVHHRITPNEFTTTFSGVRVSKYKIPINTDLISLANLIRYFDNTSDRVYDSSYSDDDAIQFVLNREIFRKTQTIGRLYVNGDFLCYTIEDGIKSDDVCKTKGDDHPILYGDYPIKLTYSNKFSRKNYDDYERSHLYCLAGCGNEVSIYLPLIEGVPGREGIRIHMGSDEGWSEGCIIVGYPIGTKGDNVINDDEILKGIKSFTKGTYTDRCANPTSFTSYNAFVKLNNIIKEADDNKKEIRITIKQNLTDEEISKINNDQEEEIIKILPPPTYMSNNNSTSLGGNKPL